MSDSKEVTRVNVTLEQLEGAEAELAAMMIEQSLRSSRVLDPASGRGGSGTFVGRIAVLLSLVGFFVSVGITGSRFVAGHTAFHWAWIGIPTFLFLAASFKFGPRVRSKLFAAVHDSMAEGARRAFAPLRADPPDALEYEVGSGVLTGRWIVDDAETQSWSVPAAGLRFAKRGRHCMALFASATAQAPKAIILLDRVAAGGAMWPRSIELQVEEFVLPSPAASNADAEAPVEQSGAD